MMINAHLSDIGMDSRSLAGSLGSKLKAVRQAGFTRIALTHEELANHPEGLDAALATVRASGLRVSALLTRCDFEGLSGPLHDYKLGVAMNLLELCHAARCRLLVLPASALPQASADEPLLVRNLRQLAMLAIPLNIRIAYQPWSGASVCRQLLPTWELLCQADMPNLGLCLDSCELLGAAAPLEDLELLDGSRLFLVQLADLLDDMTTGLRVFPGEGAHTAELADMVSSLHRLGYCGDYSLAACNDDYRHLPPAQIAQRARRAAIWLGQDVLQRSVPLPNQIRLRRAAPA